MVVGQDDPSLTPSAGLVLVAEVDRILGVASTIDSYVGSIKRRRQGLSAGELVLSMAEPILAGGDFMIDLDNQARPDEAGAALRAVPSPPASTTFIALARRFDDVSIGDLGDAMGVLVRRAFAALPEARRRDLASQRPTIDLDPTDIEVYGTKKEGVAYNYAGQRAGRAHPVMWAEAGMVLAAAVDLDQSPTLGILPEQRPAAGGADVHAVGEVAPEGVEEPLGVALAGEVADLLGAARVLPPSSAVPPVWTLVDARHQ